MQIIAAVDWAAIARVAIPELAVVAPRPQGKAAPEHFLEGEFRPLGDVAARQVQRPEPARQVRAKPAGSPDADRGC